MLLSCWDYFLCSLTLHNEAQTAETVMCDLSCLSPIRAETLVSQRCVICLCSVDDTRTATRSSKHGAYRFQVVDIQYSRLSTFLRELGHHDPKVRGPNHAPLIDCSTF